MAELYMKKLTIGENTYTIPIPTKTSQLTNDSNFATQNYVNTAIANLPEPMIFKGSLGTGGTITTLPTASASNEGFTYKVITAGSYASQEAKKGDTFISDGNAWILIPSGDEPGGTVTSITLKAGGGIILDTDNTAITTSGTRTISHKDTSSQASVTNTGMTYIQSMTLDGYGHVTGLTSATATDTKNTAGATDTSSKIFLIGATAQSDNPQTYSHDTVYVDTEGYLYSGGAKVLTSLPANIVTGTGTAGQLVVWNNGASIKSGPKIFTSTNAPSNSSGADGDFWFTYTN